jgi:hypothetical protein
MKRARTSKKPAAKPAARGEHHAQHIHCIACGRHIDPEELTSVVSLTATILTCQHGSQFAACAEHSGAAQELLDEHDRTGTGVRAAPAWH